MKFKCINDWFCKFLIFVLGFFGNFDGNVINDFKGLRGIIIVFDVEESIIYNYG